MWRAFDSIRSEVSATDFSCPQSDRASSREIVTAIAMPLPAPRYLNGGGRDPRKQGTVYVHAVRRHHRDGMCGGEMSYLGLSLLLSLQLASVSGCGNNGSEERPNEVSSPKKATVFDPM